MPKGISLHIGVNNLDSAHYTSEFGKLYGCQRDASQLANIAKRNHFEVTQSHILIDDNAKIGKSKNGVPDPTTKFSKVIEKAINELIAGDIFLLTFSGHGSEIKDPTGIEPGRKNQTLCFYDRQMIDNELAQYWIRFKAGVRIIFISDSCHSGTVAEDPIESTKRGERIRLRNLPSDLSNAIIEAHQEIYQPVFETFQETKRENQQKIEAYLISMTACQDDQKAREGNDNGLFTGVLKNLLNNNNLHSSYQDFFDTAKQKTIEKVALLDSVNGRQEPNLRFLGPEDAEGFKRFKSQKPFEISAA